MNWHISEFFKDLNVASLAATRLQNVERILNQIDFKSIKVFVELGPGDGAFTTEILKRLRKDSVLLLIESNSNFTEILRKKFTDPRIHIIQGCATKLLSFLRAKNLDVVDCILCGIPLTFLNSQRTETLLCDCATSLANNGALIIYQALNPLHKASVVNIMEYYFRSIECELLPINLPPLFVLYADTKINTRHTLDSELSLSSSRA